MAGQTANGRLIRGLLGDGQARVILCDTTEMAEVARAAHGATNVCAAALGRVISAAALLTAASEKEPRSITLSFRGGGPAGSLVAVAHGKTIKAYVDHPEITLPLKANGKLDVGGVIGREGLLTVVRDLGMKEPYIGQTPLVSGEIAEDIAMYCTASEQQPTLCALGVLCAERVLSSGGLIVQPLPGCDEDLLSQLELRAPVFADISAHLIETPPEALFDAFFRGLRPTVISDEPIAYACDCTRERMERALLSLGRAELTDMIETQRGAEIACSFCRETHAFSQDDLRGLLELA